MFQRDEQTSLREEHNAIRVLKADPDLVKHLDPATAELAQRHTIAPVVELPAGTSDSLSMGSEAPGDLLGYLIVEGLLVHRVEIAGRSGIELLGQGDFISPRSRESVPLQQSTHAQDSWEALVPTRVAVLDGEFERTVIRWPGILAELFDRAGQRACTLAFYLALSQVAGLERRLLVLLWSLAERWGTVSPEGVEIPLRLSHRLLGELVSARRPSVTTAFRSLAEQGVVCNREPYGWILKGEPPDRLATVTLEAPEPVA